MSQSQSGSELLRNVKEQIKEVDPSEVVQLLGEGVVVIDTRETEELTAGILPGAVHIPRSFLEMRIEGVVPDRSQRVILYCSAGIRSALGARTLIDEMGYEEVESMAGGFTLWKDRGYEVEVPRSFSAEQRERYSRHLLVPEVGVEGQQKLLDARRAETRDFGENAGDVAPTLLPLERNREPVRLVAHSLDEEERLAIARQDDGE